MGYASDDSDTTTPACPGISLATVEHAAYSHSIVAGGLLEMS